MQFVPPSVAAALRRCAAAASLRSCAVGRTRPLVPLPGFQPSSRPSKTSPGRGAPRRFAVAARFRFCYDGDVSRGAQAESFLFLFNDDRPGKLPLPTILSCLARIGAALAHRCSSVHARLVFSSSKGFE